MVVDAVAAVNVAVVDAAAEKITAGSEYGFPSREFNKVKLPKEPVLPERVPAMVCGEAPFR